MSMAQSLLPEFDTEMKGTRADGILPDGRRAGSPALRTDRRRADVISVAGDGPGRDIGCWGTLRKADVMRNIRLSGLALALVVVASSGCVAAAAGGLGAGIYYSDRGAQSLVVAPIDKVFGAAQQTFQELGITETKNSTDTGDGTTERQLKGTGNDRDVTVTLKTEGSSTRVEVVASKSAVTWDKDLAKSILEKIVEKSK
jgi:hypothetical protein